MEIFKNLNISETIYELTELYPNELIFWCHVELVPFINHEKIASICNSNNEISSYSISNENYIYVNDVGILNAGNLETNYTYIRSSSTGDCRLKVNNEVGYEILYTGNIYYTGNAAIVSQLVEGTGKLIHY